MGDLQGLGLGGHEPRLSDLEPGARLGGLSGSLSIHPGGCSSRPLPPIYLHMPSSGEPQFPLCTTEERFGRGGCLRWGHSPIQDILCSQVFLALGELLLSCNWAVVADILLVGMGCMLVLALLSSLGIGKDVRGHGAGVEASSWFP